MSAPNNASNITSNNNNVPSNAPDATMPTAMSGIEATGTNSSRYADPLVIIRQDIESLKNKLKDLAVKKVQLSAINPKSAEVDQQVKELVAKQLELQQELHIMKTTLAELTSDLPSVTTDSSSGESLTSKPAFKIDPRCVPVFQVIGVNEDRNAKADDIKIFGSVNAFMSKIAKIIQGANVSCI